MRYGMRAYPHTHKPVGPWTACSMERRRGAVVCWNSLNTTMKTRSTHPCRVGGRRGRGGGGEGGREGGQEGK